MMDRLLDLLIVFKFLAFLWLIQEAKRWKTSVAYMKGVKILSSTLLHELFNCYMIQILTWWMFVSVTVVCGAIILALSKMHFPQVWRPHTLKTFCPNAYLPAFSIISNNNRNNWMLKFILPPLAVSCMQCVLYQVLAFYSKYNSASDGRAMLKLTHMYIMYCMCY